MKTFIFISILSLGGLPPLLGFFPKWMIIQFMIYNSIHVTAIILVILSLLTLFFYLWIIYTSLLLTNTEMMWSTINFSTEKNYNETFFSLSLVTMGILSCTLIFML